MARHTDSDPFNFNTVSERPYGNSIVLNEMHNLFPAFLYDNTQFRNLDDVFLYVENQMNDRFNIFNSNRNAYRQRYPRHVFTPASRGVGRRGRGGAHRGSGRAAPQPAPLQQRGNAPVNSFLSSRSSSVSPTRVSNDFLRNLVVAAIIDPAFNNAAFNEPVLVVPSTQQLASSTTIITAAVDLETPCAICQDSMNAEQELRSLNVCGHAFHTTCIDTWFQRNVHCPVCRHDIRE
jgi:hypothetical protein